jgi:hypothetical protein
MREESENLTKELESNEADVWDYIKRNRIPCNSLYDFYN